jgi:hypothetical protein
VAEVVVGEALDVDGFGVADVLDVVVVAVVGGVVVGGVVVMVITGTVGGIVTIVNVMLDVVDVVAGIVLIVDVAGSVGSQSRVIGQRDGRDWAGEENASEPAP